MSELASAAIGYVGHKVHVVRRREAKWLLDALGDVRGQVILDVAGGDGYWAAQLARRGAYTVAIDLAEGKLQRGRTLPQPPGLVKGDALHLPFPDRSVDGTLSICAIEHFPDGKAALAEMARVTKPGGLLALSADALCAEHKWPSLSSGHRERYHVVDTYDEAKLTDLLDATGFDVLKTEYLFRETWAQNVYLRLHQWKLAPNALAPLSPLVAWSDRRSDEPGGSILLVHARRR
ncbi:MAG TPA: class I SAM-dependent methyltransferase [Acidimicrobiales bacterium]